MIHLDGVAVPQVEEEYLDFKPYDHQAKAQELLKEQDRFFAVNTSPTGSGKTYSWLKPALDEGINTISVFPTNALIADQRETAEQLVESRYPEANVVEVTGETVAEWREDSRSAKTKGDVLRRELDRSLNENKATIVLTNPDIFTLMRKDMYRHTDVSDLPNRFGMLVFDEFHLSDVKQRDLLLFLVDEIDSLPDEQSRANRFYFLTATPDESSIYRSLESRIRQDIRREPDMIRAEATPISEADDDYRGVMPPVDIELRDTETFNTADRLLDEDTFHDFVEFCRRGQTVVMLDGVHEVDEVYNALKDEMDAEVHRITGFNDEEAREKIKEFDVLVSNAAVEVGLDFQPERLVFSASNDSKLIQRLGRLRKLEGRDEPHKAWCYVPSSVRAKVEAKLDTDEMVPRSEFEEAVKSVFDDELDLSSYSTRWSEIEAYHHVLERKDDVPSGDKREQVHKEGLQRIERHYYRPYDRDFGEDDLKRLHNATDERLIDEMKTYRSSGLQVMVRDNVAGEMKMYDMLHLLRWGKSEFYPESEFSSLLSDEENQFYRAYKDYSVGFCEFDGKLSGGDEDEYPGRTIKFKSGNSRIHGMIEENDSVREPGLVGGLDIKMENNNAPRIPGVSNLRDGLDDAERLVYAFPGHPSSNEAYYGFDDFFFVYPFFRQGGDCSITFGTTALYMHCLVQDKQEEEVRDRDYTWD